MFSQIFCVNKAEGQGELLKKYFVAFSFWKYTFRRCQIYYTVI